jgi:hypothetical protein
MALFYADENFDFPTVLELRRLGHDVLTAQEAGQAQQRIPDPMVLAFGTILGRSILTHNRRHFIRLHNTTTGHAGIIVCTRDDDSAALAARIDLAVRIAGSLADQLLRVNLPSSP